jgi:hypothetical protein
VLAAGLVLTAARANAQVAVVIEGENVAKIRQHVVRQAPTGVRVIDEWTFADSLGKNSLAGELGGRINQASTRGDFVQQVVVAAKAASVTLVILARTLPNEEALWILVIDAKTGGIELDREIALHEKDRPKPKKGRKKSGNTGGGGLDWTQVDAVLDPIYAKIGAAGGAAATTGGGGSSNWGTPNWASGSGSKPTPASAKLLETDNGTGGTATAQADETEISKSARTKQGVGLEGAFVLIRPGYALSGRRFSYSGPKTDNLRPYRALGVSQVGIDLEAYPAAIPQIEVAENLGLHFDYRQAIGLKSSPKYNKSITLTTTWREMDVDLRYRLFFDPVLLHLFVGYSTLAFTFEIADGDPLAGQVPDLSYSFMRTGLELRVNAGPLAVLAGGAYRLVFGTGKLGDSYFPDSKTMGYDASVGAALPIVPHFEMVGLLYFTHFGHTLNPAAAASYLATSATDNFYGLRLGAQLDF